MQKINGNTAMLVEFGPGHEVNVADHIVATGVNKLLICFGSVHVREQGLFQSIARKLTRAGVAWNGYSTLAETATLSAVQDAISFAGQVGAEAILSIGGGGLLDNMKVSAATVEYCGEPWEYYAGTENIAQTLPVYALLKLTSSKRA
ncbi:iron-containing alcohol dehydrogenase [Citrobacter amalonaticus]|uniref:iron-containing alcohol dehydrogenase n=1 Tax=Citrobacter amalonaticus TaxID=35703 RepID=UPI0019041295|nr:iron-containing alcohol dehydrogenase [Citrobacter amalonaticus]MBJ9276477.1 iron-containing alcohol dehydrogenase [Citrobacter amalonaticus]